MGVGDEIMASGMARGAHTRGRRVAFGDDKRIIWGPHAEQIFRGNPNVAPPGSEGATDLEWIKHYAGRRLYNRLDGNRWIWNYEFKAPPGEIFFDPAEKALAASVAPGFVLIEPNVPGFKKCAPNKQWEFARYQLVADRLRLEGHRVVQLVYAGARFLLQRVERIQTRSFRDALALLSRAAIYIGAEGGMHHGAAALNVPGVVIFGGFIPPAVTGYDIHTNLAVGTACGSIKACAHCAAALAEITVDQVYEAAKDLLGRA